MRREESRPSSSDSTAGGTPAFFCPLLSNAGLRTPKRTVALDAALGALARTWLKGKEATMKLPGSMCSTTNEILTRQGLTVIGPAVGAPVVEQSRYAHQIFERR
jgi:hypothetical protein